MTDFFTLPGKVYRKRPFPIHDALTVAVLALWAPAILGPIFLFAGWLK